jgi:hypothetical protein
LRPRNELSVEVADATGGPWGGVVLEIRCRAYLSAVACEPAGEDRWAIRGRVEGECDGLLELYALIDGAHRGYQTCRPGEAFSLVTDAHPVTGPSVLRLDLVCGPLVWHTAELELPNPPTPPPAL